MNRDVSAPLAAGGFGDAVIGERDIKLARLYCCEWRTEARLDGSRRGVPGHDDESSLPHRKIVHVRLYPVFTRLSVTLA